MSVDPYRTPAHLVAEPPARQPVPPHDVAFLAGLLWVLALARVVFAVASAEAPSRELHFAWLLVLVAPWIAWKEIAARRAS